MPMRAAVPLSGVVCRGDSSCLPLTTIPAISDRAGRDDSAWMLPSTALLASEDCDAWVSMSAAVALASGVCDTGGAWVVSAAMLLMGGDGAGEPAVIGPGVTAVGEFVPSHSNNPTPPAPAAANTLTVTAALRNRVGRLCGSCAAKRGLDATASAVIV